MCVWGVGGSCIDSREAAQETSHHLHLDCALTHNTNTRSRAREVEVLSWGAAAGALVCLCMCTHRRWSSANSHVSPPSSRVFPPPYWRWSIRGGFHGINSTVAYCLLDSQDTPRGEQAGKYKGGGRGGLRRFHLVNGWITWLERGPAGMLPCQERQQAGKKRFGGWGVKHKTKHLKQTRTQERTDAEEILLGAFVLVSLEKSALLQRCCAQG